MSVGFQTVWTFVRGWVEKNLIKESFNKVCVGLYGCLKNTLPNDQCMYSHRNWPSGVKMAVNLIRLYQYIVPIDKFPATI